MAADTQTQVATDTRLADLGQEALRYAKWKWAIFPCSPHGEPLCEGGTKAATTDAVTIRAWWTRWPDANLGTPARDHVILLAEGPEGLGTLAELESRYGSLPQSMCIRAGAKTIMFFEPNGSLIGGSVELGPGVRILGQDEHALLTRSVDATSGDRYRYVVKLAPVPAPPWLAALLPAPTLFQPSQHTHTKAAPPADPDSDGHQEVTAVAEIVEDDQQAQPEPEPVAETEADAQPARGTENTAPGPVSIEDVRAAVAQHLYVPTIDLDAIDFCLAVVVSNQLRGDPVWAMLIDASGGGKTETLRTLRKRPEAYFLSTLTEKTLVSGYRDPKRPKHDPSLLPQLKGKVLVIKDLSPLLSMRRESRNVIMGDLRDAYDGFTDQGRGNLGRITYEAKFSVLAASTLALDRFDAFDDELGERFIKFRCRSDRCDLKVSKAISNMGNDEPIREGIEGAVSKLLDRLAGGRQTAKMPGSFIDTLATIADFVARARSHVARNRNHDVLYLPRPEVGTRLVKELAKLACSLAIVRGKAECGEAELRTVTRVAEDCLPPNRLAVLRCLRNGASSAYDIESAISLPSSTTGRVLEDLKVLGITKDNGLWELRPEWVRRLQSVRIFE